MPSERNLVAGDRVFKCDYGIFGVLDIPRYAHALVKEGVFFSAIFDRILVRAKREEK